MSDQQDWTSGSEKPPNQPSSASANHQQLAGQLVGAVAHDLNNLLATILGCLELIERRADDPERLKALVKRSSDAVERAARLTSRFARFARRQAQGNQSTDVNALVADLMPLIASALGRRIRVSTNTPSVPVYAGIDPAGLEATLLALCLAARSGLPETGSVSLAIQVAESTLKISLAASGPGLHQLDLAQPCRIASVVDLEVRPGPSAGEAEIVVPLSPATA